MITVEPDHTLPNTFLLTLYSGWNWHDVEAADAAVRSASHKAGDAPVHVIVQVNGPIAMPGGIDLRAKPWLDVHKRDHGGLLIFVTRWAMIRSLLHLIHKEFAISLDFIHLVHSLDEAREIVAAHLN